MKYFILILSIALGGCAPTPPKAYVFYTKTNPSESVVFKLPDGNKANWKEILRQVNGKEGLVESIPNDQTEQNWTDLIAIQYIGNVTKKNVPSLDVWINGMRSSFILAHPGKKVTWKVIEKHNSDFIYEWALHEAYGSVAPQHEVARLFITESGTYRAGFTRKNSEMSPEEKEKLIKLLKENTAIVSYSAAGRDAEAFSLATPPTSKQE